MDSSSASFGGCYSARALRSDRTDWSSNWLHFIFGVSDSNEQATLLVGCTDAFRWLLLLNQSRDLGLDDREVVAVVRKLLNPQLRRIQIANSELLDMTRRLDKFADKGSVISGVQGNVGMQISYQRKFPNARASSFSPSFKKELRRVKEEQIDSAPAVKRSLMLVRDFLHEFRSAYRNV